jgi:hypothetical protein
MGRCAVSPAEATQGTQRESKVLGAYPAYVRRYLGRTWLQKDQIAGTALRVGSFAAAQDDGSWDEGDSGVLGTQGPGVRSRHLA